MVNSSVGVLETHLQVPTSCPKQDSPWSTFSIYRQIPFFFHNVQKIVPINRKCLAKSIFSSYICLPFLWIHCCSSLIRMWLSKIFHSLMKADFCGPIMLSMTSGIKQGKRAYNIWWFCHSFQSDKRSYRTHFSSYPRIGGWSWICVHPVQGPWLHCSSKPRVVFHGERCF